MLGKRKDFDGEGEQEKAPNTLCRPEIIDLLKNITRRYYEFLSAVDTNNFPTNEWVKLEIDDLFQGIDLSKDDLFATVTELSDTSGGQFVGMRLLDFMSWTPSFPLSKELKQQLTIADMNMPIGAGKHQGKTPLWFAFHSLISLQGSMYFTTEPQLYHPLARRTQSEPLDNESIEINWAQFGHWVSFEQLSVVPTSDVHSILHLMLMRYIENKDKLINIFQDFGPLFTMEHLSGQDDPFGSTGLLPLLKNMAVGDIELYLRFIGHSLIGSDSMIIGDPRADRLVQAKNNFLQIYKQAQDILHSSNADVGMDFAVLEEAAMSAKQAGFVHTDYLLGQLCSDMLCIEKSIEYYRQVPNTSPYFIESRKLAAEISFALIVNLKENQTNTVEMLEPYFIPAITCALDIEDVEIKNSMLQRIASCYIQGNSTTHLNHATFLSNELVQQFSSQVHAQIIMPLLKQLKQQYELVKQKDQQIEKLRQNSLVQDNHVLETSTTVGPALLFNSKVKKSTGEKMDSKAHRKLSKSL